MEDKNKDSKERNPRITVCYKPEEYAEIMTNAKSSGLKKSQYVHDESLGHHPAQIMSDEQTEALMSLRAGRSELTHIRSALKGKSQEELKKYFHDEEFMAAWIEATTYLIRRMLEIDNLFTKRGYGSGVQNN